MVGRLFSFYTVATGKLSKKLVSIDVLNLLKCSSRKIIQFLVAAEMSTMIMLLARQLSLCCGKVVPIFAHFVCAILPWYYLHPKS